MVLDYCFTALYVPRPVIAAYVSVREVASAAAPQPGPLDLRDDLVPRPLRETGLPSLISLLVHIGGDLPGTRAKILNNAGSFGHKSSLVKRKNIYPRPEWSAYYKSRISRKSRLLQRLGHKNRVV